jgi:DNA-binding winged helix-turn-helix (wHTH) protein
MPGVVYEFGEFRLDCGRFELVRNSHRLRVERKPMELLILLASREGQLVARQEIAERLWSSEVFVDTEHGINTAIRKLRHLLRDDPNDPHFIQTVTGMGYRFRRLCRTYRLRSRPNQFWQLLCLHGGGFWAGMWEWGSAWSLHSAAWPFIGRATVHRRSGIRS